MLNDEKEYMWLMVTLWPVPSSTQLFHALRDGYQKPLVNSNSQVLRGLQMSLQSRYCILPEEMRGLSVPEPQQDQQSSKVEDSYFLFGEREGPQSLYIPMIMMKYPIIPLKAHNHLSLRRIESGAFESRYSGIKFGLFCVASNINILGTPDSQTQDRLPRSEQMH